MAGFNFVIDFPIGPEWRNAELLRTAILRFLTISFDDEDFRQTIGIVTGELLENAIKFGDWSREGEQSFSLRVHGEGELIFIEISNPVIPDHDNFENLLLTVERIRNADSRREAYEERLRQLAEDPDATSGRLGLARIAYECDTDLEATLEPGDIVRVRAALKPPKPPAG